MTATRTPREAWLILAGLTFGVCVTNGFARFAYGLVLPAMREDLGWSYAQAGWLNTANALGYLAGAVLVFGLASRVTATRLFAFGVWSTALALLLTGLEEALWAQTLGRTAAGVLGAMSFATGGALASALFPGDARRTALAIAIYFGVGGGMGIVLAGATIPPLLALHGAQAWAWGWLAIGGLSLAMCIPALAAVRRLRAGPQAPPQRVRLPLRGMLAVLAGYAAFGLSYIVYMTFIAAWMTAQQASAAAIAGMWVLLGLGIMASPFVWRGVFARYDTGTPLALVLVTLAFGTSLPVLWPTVPGVVVSGIVTGLSVFMSPGAITNFIRQNLPPEAWNAAISLFTVAFALAQTLGPIGAGLVGDATGDIGLALLAAAGVMLAGAAAAMAQGRLPEGA